MNTPPSGCLMGANTGAPTASTQFFIKFDIFGQTTSHVKFSSANLCTFVIMLYVVQNSPSISAMRSRSLVLTLGCMGGIEHDLQPNRWWVSGNIFDAASI